ncbi:MAG: ATP-binding protein [Chloroflexi bacterium]|nr:ATP-binding protein [Chloroflexota bacterium]
MESLGDILNKQTRTNISEANTVTSSSADVPSCPQCKGAGFIHPRLASGEPDFSRVIACRCQAKSIEQERLESLQLYSNLAPLSRLNFDSFEVRRPSLNLEQRDNLERAFSTARDFAGDPRGWLVLQGVNGCGKTHLAAAIGNLQLKMGKPVLFVSVADLLDHLRSTFAPESPVSYDDLFDRVKNTPLLILDDLGEHSATPWAREKLYQIINHRYNCNLATVFTTCLALDDIETRISSRMADPRVSNVFNILAPDFRSDLRLPRAKTPPQSRRRGQLA